MRILVTGATGFVGSNLCEELLKNHKVIGISKTGNSERSQHLLKNKKFKLLKCDLAKPKKIVEILNKNPIDAVIHLAANLVSNESDDPFNIFRDNVIATLNVLYASQQSGTKNIIYASTMNVYGKPEYIPLDEKHPANPDNFYGLSKLMGEMYCKFYHEKYCMNVIILRFSGIYGPKRRGGAAAIFIEKAIKGQPISVNNDGNYIWDMVYVKDVMNVFASSLEKINKIKFNIFNIGCGPDGVMMKDMIEKIVKISGSNSKVEFKNEPGNFKFYYNIEKAKKILNFNPRTLEEGLSDYINYIKSEIR